MPHRNVRGIKIKESHSTFQQQPTKRTCMLCKSVAKLVIIMPILFRYVASQCHTHTAEPVSGVVKRGRRDREEPTSNFAGATNQHMKVRLSVNKLRRSPRNLPQTEIDRHRIPSALHRWSASHDKIGSTRALSDPIVSDG